MRSAQFSNLQDAIGGRPGAARDFVDQLSEMQGDGEKAREKRRYGLPSMDDGWIHLAIGGLSLLLGVLAWQRDRGKSRQELFDAGIFLALGALERYIAARQRSER